MLRFDPVDIQIGIIFVIAIVLTWALVIFSSRHVSLVLSNRTTIEQVEYKDRFREVCVAVL